MGIFMDTLEDNSERKGMLRDDRRVPGKVRYVTLHYCPVCGGSSESEAELQHHMFRYHRHYQSYVKVNNLVITKESCVREPIERIEVFYTGTKFVEGRWETRGRKGKFIAESGAPFRLYPSHALPVLDGPIDIYLGSGRQEHAFHIILADNPGLRYELMEEMYFAYQSSYLSDPGRFVWSEFRNAFQRSGLNAFELRFISGLYDYLYGVHLETCGEDNKASKLYELASAQLGPFPTLLAHTVKSTISYKLNWFKRLGHVPRGSVFYPLGHFFNHLYSELVARDLGLTPEMPDQGVHVDDFHFTYRQAVLHFYANEPERLGACLEELHGLADRQNVIHKEKLELLEGRYYRMIGQPKEAVYRYGSMTHHPYFSQEIEFMKAST